MTEKLYIVQHETIDANEEVVSSFDLLLTDSYDDAVAYAENKAREIRNLDEQITISKVTVTDGEIDYEGADLQWVSGI